jgi:hypothetical protein
MWRAPDADVNGLVAPMRMLGDFATFGIIRVG